MPARNSPTGMPDAAWAALATPGLEWLALTIGIAGFVRGFTGFGTALIFVPVAGIFLPPAQVIAVITLTGVASTAALLPRAWGQADLRQVALLAFAALLTVPLGLVIMDRLDAVSVRWIVSGVAGTTLLALVLGWRYGGHVSWPGLVAIGAAAGVVGGMTGMTGPVVILFYLSGHGLVQLVRANTIVFLSALDVVIVVNLLWRGDAEWVAVWLAGILAVPYFLTTLAGQALFAPARQKLYRYAAFTVIGIAVVSGLPIWT